MRPNLLSSLQPKLRLEGQALEADLPKVLRGLGYILEPDSFRGWRIPGHGGLIIWQREDETWGWKQFSTDEGGDAISFLTQWGGMTRQKAIETLMGYGQVCPVQAQAPVATPRGLIRETKLPNPSWIKNATKLASRFQKELWKDKKLKVWDWLHARGLRDKTIKSARLGWIPKAHWEERNKWGLEELLNEQERARKMLFPKGLAIPALRDSEDAIRIRIRQFATEGRPYHTVAGSCMNPLILGEIRKPIVIVESDLDAWLIYQEAGEFITVSSLGSAGTKPDCVLAVYLLATPQILVALDSDEAGRKASQWWVKTFPKSKLWPVPWGKDPGEAFGGAPKLVRQWIEHGLQKRREMFIPKKAGARSINRKRPG